MLPYYAVEVLEYLDWRGHSPFAEWFESLPAPAAARVTVAVTRLRLGNFSNVKSVGSGVHEYRIDFGPGFRIHVGKDGERLVILLAGGTKKRQQKDIEDAIARWQDYKRRKRTE
jgi:putative addiction module killer protein